MFKNKNFWLSSALISSFLIEGAIANENDVIPEPPSVTVSAKAKLVVPQVRKSGSSNENEARFFAKLVSERTKELRGIEGNKIVQQSLKTLPSGEVVSNFSETDEDLIDFQYLNLVLNGATEINQFISEMKRIEDSYERIGGAGTLAPWAKGYYTQKSARLLKSAAGYGFELVKPFIFAGLSRIAVDVAASQLGPRFVNYVGKAAANMASNTNSFWTKYDPTGLANSMIKKSAYSVAEGEALRKVGTIADYVQNYSIAVVSAASKVTCSAVNLTKSGVTSICSRIKGWFSSPVV